MRIKKINYYYVEQKLLNIQHSINISAKMVTPTFNSSFVKF